MDAQHEPLAVPASAAVVPLEGEAPGDAAADTTANDAAIAAALQEEQDAAEAREAAAAAAAAEAAEAEAARHTAAAAEGGLEGLQRPPASAGPPRDYLHDSLEAIKLGGLRIAAMIKPRGELAAAGAAGSPADAPEAPAASGDGAMSRLASAAVGLGARAKQSGSRFLEVSSKTAAATAEGIRRMAAGEPMQALVRNEAASKPVPHLVLACCTYLTAGGLNEPCLFQHVPPAELVQALAATMGPRAKLIQPGTSPHAVAALLKQFLAGLPEPLLTYRLLPQWVAVADAPDNALTLMAQLPPANANSMRLLLQLCHHINDRAATTEMDAQALAEALAPCLAWKPAPKPAAPSGSAAPGAGNGGGGGPLQAIGRVLSGAMRRKDGEDVHDAGAPAELAAAGEQLPGDATGALEVHVTPLDAVERQAIVEVLTHLISSFVRLFG